MSVLSGENVRENGRIGEIIGGVFDDKKSV